MRITLFLSHLTLLIKLNRMSVPILGLESNEFWTLLLWRLSLFKAAVRSEGDHCLNFRRWSIFDRHSMLDVVWGGSYVWWSLYDSGHYGG